MPFTLGAPHSGQVASCAWVCSLMVLPAHFLAAQLQPRSAPGSPPVPPPPAAGAQAVSRPTYFWLFRLFGDLWGKSRSAHPLKRITKPWQLLRHQKTERTVEELALSVIW